MAPLLPSDLSHLALAGAREPESEALRQLRPGSRPPSGIKFDELDFMVVNQGGKALATR